MKTEASIRDVPLLGVLLEAMRRHPEGFPRYRGKPTHWSNAVNKFMREAGILPSDRHSAYSLRHSFEDRMLAEKSVDRLAADLMGHTDQREKYGRGAFLEMKADAIEKIAL